MNPLANTVAVVTGGGSGIGRAIALRLRDAGARVFAVGRRAEKLAGLDGVATAVCDVTDEAAVARAFADCRQRLGPVAILVNNAGLGMPTPDLATADLATVQAMVATNITGTFLCVREALKDMKAAGRGHILNVVSVVGKKTNPTAPVYCASKFGQRGLSSGIADQCLQLGIKVTDLNPGATDTDYWGDRAVPRAKFLTPDDVAEAALFVLSQPERVLIRELDLESMSMMRK